MLLIAIESLANVEAEANHLELPKRNLANSDSPAALLMQRAT